MVDEANDECSSIAQFKGMETNLAIPLFPHIRDGQVLDPQLSTSLDKKPFTKMLAEMTKITGILPSDMSFTTHSFRRGGMQMRLLHAPAIERLSFTQAKAWGGWSTREGPGAFIAYIVNFIEADATDVRFLFVNGLDGGKRTYSQTGSAHRMRTIGSAWAIKLT